MLVRFENHLDENPLNLDRQDFGSPDYSFLTHLHNGHTAPESDGNPHYSFLFGPKDQGYPVKSFVDNLYLNWPAGNDSREKQSFFWFHDHRMDHTGSNVYKGMVGLYPIYDPKNNLDAGDETQGLRLPGVRTNHADGTFDVDFDIPLAIYDVRLDDGVTNHKDFHDGHGRVPGRRQPADAPGVVGQDLPQALPQPRLRRRHLHRQRHRVPGAGGEAAQVPVPLPGRVDLPDLRVQADDLDQRARSRRSTSATPGRDLQGQWRIEDGQQCMRWTEIADDGGLLPFPITRDSFELWPAKRREHIVDFTKYQDGSPTKKGDVIYLTNVMKMPDGRMWTNSSRFSARPEVQDPDDEDRHRRRRCRTTASCRARPSKLRDLPPLPANWQTLLDDRLIFEVQRGSRRRRARVAHQRQAVRPDHRADQPDEQGRSPVPGDAEEELLQPVGDPQRRRRLGAPLPPAHGRAPDRDAEQQGRHASRRTRATRTTTPAKTSWRWTRPSPRSSTAASGLRRTVRRALPQPRARGPRHDVRLDDRAIRSLVTSTYG